MANIINKLLGEILFRNIIKKSGLSLKFIIFFVSLRVLTDYSFIDSFNEWLVGHVGYLVHFDYTIIYDFLISIEYEVQYNAIFGIFASLYLPPLIAIYSLSKDTNLLYKLYISKTFSIETIIKFLFLVLISQKSTSLPYFFFVALYIFSGLKNTYVQFRDFLFFKRKESVLNFLKDVIGYSSKERVKYLNVLKELDGWNNHLIGLKKFKDDDKYECFWTHSFSRPASVDLKKLSEWFEKVKNNIKLKEEIEAQTRVGTTENTDQITPDVSSQVAYGEPFDLDIVRDDESLSISIFIKYDTRYELDEENSSLYNKQFKDCFIMCKKTLGEEEEKFREYIENIDSQLLSLLEKKDFDKFNEEIKLIRDVIDHFKKDDSLSREIVTLTFKILDLVESTNAFNEYQLCKSTLLDFWVSLFKSFMYVENAKYMDYAFKILAKALDKKILSKKDIKRLERDLTSTIKYSKATKDFFVGYVKALAEIARRLTDEDKDTFTFFIKLIHNLQYDVKKGYLGKDDEDTANVTLQYSRQACMFLGAITLYEGKKELFQISTTFIELPTFFSTLEELYLDDEREWRASWWGEGDFDRHGQGRMKTFCSTTFHKNFIVELFKIKGSLKAIDKQIPNYRLKYLFSEALKSFEESESEAYKTINDIVEKCQKIEDDKIISSSISDKKIDEFISACFDEYKRRTRLSEILKFQVQKVKEDDGLGYNTTMPKDYFSEDFSIIVSGLNSHGRGLAAGENGKIYSEIKEYIKPKTADLNDLFTNVIQQWVKKGRTHILITNHHDWEDRLFSWDGKCKVNENLLREFNAEKKEKFVLSDSKDEIDVYRLSWDRNKEARFYMLVEKNNHISGLLRVKNDDFKIKDSLVYRVQDLSKLPDLRKKIIDGNEYFKESEIPDEERDRYLSLKVTVQLYVSPKLNEIIDEYKQEIEIFEINDVEEDGDE